MTNRIVDTSERFELDELLREAVVHIHNLLTLVEGPRELSEHEYNLGAGKFWLSLRAGMCSMVLTGEDGIKRACPNQAEPGRDICSTCAEQL